ncbi:chemotaxis protein CheD [Methylotuvimicrobium sp. KM1]|uniref:chemotaxis protein CheD n=1 Tax=Methylotuvimicrobium sp. KM1 TaxID=3377707 RepID=UPI00384FB04B
MIVQPYKETRRVIIEPGEYYVSTNGELISTLLGSCVAACLFDPVNKIAGMNHFLLAYQHHSRSRPIIETEEGRYGLYAMELLINDMMKKGAKKSRIKAKCFGGGNVLHLRSDKTDKLSVGEVNIEFIKTFLAQEKIPILAASFGGTVGRSIHFVSSDFSVYVKTIETALTQQLEKQERSFWKKRIDAQEKIKSDVEFW